MFSMYHDILPCLNQVDIGGFLECRAPVRLIDMCPKQCKYFIEDKAELIHEKEEYKKHLQSKYDELYKPKWNESRHRCYEGIPIDKKIPKTHDDEWEHKQCWKEEYKNFMIKWLGPIWCVEHGII